jgi:mitochondrial import receptor subunit TOM70
MSQNYWFALTSSTHGSLARSRILTAAAVGGLALVTLALVTVGRTWFYRWKKEKSKEPTKSKLDQVSLRSPRKSGITTQADKSLTTHEIITEKSSLTDNNKETTTKTGGSAAATILPSATAGPDTITGVEVSPSLTSQEDPAILAKNKGNRYYIAKKYHEAIECYDEAIKLASHDDKKNPNLAIFYCNRAACFAALNEHEKVLIDCQMALKHDRNYAKAYMRRAVALEALDRHKEAAIDYSAVFILENFKNETAAQGAERTLAHCSRELSQKKMKERKFRLPSPIFIHFYFLSYKHYPGHEVTEEELRAAEKRLVEEPNDVETLFVRAKARIAHRRYDEAYADLEKCIATIGHDHLHEAYNLYATFQYLDGSLDRAQEYFDRAIETKPDWADPYIRRSHVLAEKGDLQAARADLQRAIELDPNQPDVWYNRGQIHMIAGDFQEAIADYEKAISLYPKLPFAYVQAAVARYRLGSVTTALETFEKAIKLFPKAPMIYNYYAELLIDQQRYDEALQKLDRAIELEPGAPMAYVNKSILLLQWKNDAEVAIQACRRAISVDHHCDIAYGHLGQIYMQQGKYDLAIDNFNKAIENIRSEPELFAMIQCREAALCQQETLKLLAGVN